MYVCVRVVQCLCKCEDLTQESVCLGNCLKLVGVSVCVFIINVCKFTMLTSDYSDLLFVFAK